MAAQKPIGWMAEWRGKAARRQIESKQAAVQNVQFEITLKSRAGARRA